MRPQSLLKNIKRNNEFLLQLGYIQKEKIIAKQRYDKEQIEMQKKEKYKINSIFRIKYN